MDRKSILAIVPAKGASTRLPRKNIRELAGKPLLGWTLDSALASRVFADIVVSSEDEEVLSVASRWDVETRERPHKLAVDPAGCIHVAQHVVAELEGKGRSYTHIAILMPTCPFRSVEDICAAVAELNQGSAGVVISVSEFSHTPFNGFTLEAEGNLSPITPAMFGCKTQELPAVYRPNGAIFIMARDTLMASSHLYPEPMRPVIMPEHRSVDIDNELDLQWAAFLLDHGVIN